jgi:hypothetical protein
MKKLLLAVLLWVFGAASAFAQVGYDLEFFNFRLEKDQAPVDTVYKDCEYQLAGGIRNNGPGTFPGYSGLVMNVWVGRDSVDHATLQPMFTMPAFNLSAINPNGTATISMPLKILDNYFKVDSNNIIIVWPYDTYQDEDQENNYAHTDSVFASSDSTQCTSGMQETYGTLRFGMYPNPAQNELHLNLGLLNQDGQIAIMDIMGHTVYTTLVQRGEMELTLPLSSELANGLYFVSLHIGDKVGVSKLQIKH